MRCAIAGARPPTGRALIHCCMGFRNDLFGSGGIRRVPAQAQRSVDFYGAIEALGREIELPFRQPADVIGGAAFGSHQVRVARAISTVCARSSSVSVSCSPMAAKSGSSLSATGLPLLTP